MLTMFSSLLIQGSNEEGRWVNSAADDGMCRALDYMSNNRARTETRPVTLTSSVYLCG